MEPQNPQPQEPEVGNTPNQIFDISEDNISPISTDDLAASPIVLPIPPQESSIENEKRSTPPPEEELLDRKIGTFDPTPFAPAARQVAPQTPSPMPIVQKSDTPPQVPYRTTINQLGLVQPAYVPQTQKYPVKKPAPIVLQDKVNPPIPLVKTPAQSLQAEITAALPRNLRDQQTEINRPITGAPVLNIQDLGQNIPQEQAPTPSSLRPNDFPRQEIKPVRTYESDVAEAMSHKRTSKASIAIAESKKQDGNETLGNNPPSHAGKKMAMLLLALILLGGGTYGAYYLYSKSALAPVAPLVQKSQVAPSIIPQNAQVVVTIETQSPLAIRQHITNEINKTQAPNSIKELIIATKDSMGTLTRVSAQEMIKALDMNVPDILSRSLTANWMLGVYNDPDGVTSVFIVSTTNFFQNTFAGMLQWERVMADDLKQYLFPSTVEGISNEPSKTKVPIVTNPLDNINSILPRTGTTTATSTTPVMNTAMATTTATSTNFLIASTTEIVEPLRTYITIKGKFEDRIVKNKDVRAFRADTGAILFLYSFIDNTHLVITDRESTLAEILSRLEKQSFIR